MPTYDYGCETCGHEFEVFSKKATRARARKCPSCGDRATRRISGGAGFLFKGQGFYTTDYRSAEYRSKAESEKGASKPKKGGDEKGRADSKKKDPEPS